MNKILKTAALISGAVVMLNGLLISVVSNFNMGNLATLLLGTVLILFGVFYNKLYRWIKIVFALCLALLIICMSLLLGFGTNNNVNYKEDAVIVLGAAVHGERPSLPLVRRLDAAVQYYSKNPDVKIVVSGGQGPQEAVTEASAMEKYLISNGIPQDNIIKEELSTSTYENFCNSKALFDSTLGDNYSAAFITNEYHIYRAGLTARDAGFQNITHIHSHTPWYSYLPSTLRECMAVIKVWIFGY